MKMDPILYREGYSEHGDHVGVKSGFTPFRHADGGWVVERDVVMCGERCDGGYMVTFSIEEKVFAGIEHGYQWRDLVRMTYYDKDNPESRILMANLGSQEVGGSVEESTASELFHRLFLYSKWMEHYLPTPYGYWLDHAKKYGCEIKQGVAGFGHDPLEEVKVK